MSNTLRRFTIKTALIATAVGASLGLAAPAQAGTSIPKTWNAGTHMSYAYYASSDTFCVDPGPQLDTAYVYFKTPGSSNPKISLTSKTNGWTCRHLGGAFAEGSRVQFDLYNYKTGRTSTGYLNV